MPNLLNNNHASMQMFALLSRRACWTKDLTVKKQQQRKAQQEVIVAVTCNVLHVRHTCSPCVKLHVGECTAPVLKAVVASRPGPFHFWGKCGSVYVNSHEVSFSFLIFFFFLYNSDNFFFKGWLEALLLNSKSSFTRSELFLSYFISGSVRRIPTCIKMRQVTELIWKKGEKNVTEVTEASS